MRRLIIIAVALAFVYPAAGETTYPADGWTDARDPLAARDACPGGNISTFVGQYPNSFNYYLANNTFSHELFTLMYDTLLGVDTITAAYVPNLAASWSVSDDKLTFTFAIDGNAHWSDGLPITAVDVLWTFEAVTNSPLTGPHKVSMERFTGLEVVGERTIRFHAREVHWANLLAAGSFHVLPKHAFAKLDFDKINFELPVVAGPYRIEEVKEGIFLRVRRIPKWWHAGQASSAGKLNFDTITFRFYGERENAFEAFKKGLIDIYPMHTSRLWVKETQGDKFARNWIVRQKIHNHYPVGFQGFAMNMRRTLFADIRVRKALAHLLNREKMNRTIMYNQYFMQRSYFEDLYDADNPCRNPVYDYSRDKARALLKDAGWVVNPATGYAEKDGRRLSFTFLTRDPTTDQFLQIYNEDLKDVGIEMNIDRKDWASWTKDMDAHNFDMTWAAWAATLFRNPEFMWHSKEAPRQSSSNITGFADPAVDVLIERQKSIFDIRERNALLRELDELVTAQCPYILLWNINYTRLLYWNKFGTPPTVLSKFDDADSALTYWWYDADSAADLNDAMSNDDHLAPRPPTIQFDETFKP